jgi:hypothetical protein
MNRFLYVEGNPASLIDPTGHVPAPGQLCPWGPEDCSAPGVTYTPPASITAGGSGLGGTYQNNTCSGYTCTTATTGKRYDPPKPTATIFVDIPSGPVDLTNLAYGSGDWSRLTDWCGDGGGEAYTALACEYARTGVGGPDGERIMRMLASTLVQTPPVLGDGYQFLVTQGGYDPIAGYELTAQERQDAAALAMLSGFLVPANVVYKAGRWDGEIATLPLGGPGRWVPENLYNRAAAAYQARVTGAAENWAYRVQNEAGEWLADGFAKVDGQLVLLDAKKDYSFMMKDGAINTPGFSATFTGDVLDTATHLNVAGGMPVVLVVGNEGTAAYWRLVLAKVGDAAAGTQIVVVP